MIVYFNFNVQKVWPFRKLFLELLVDCYKKWAYFTTLYMKNLKKPYKGNELFAEIYFLNSKIQVRQTNKWRVKHTRDDIRRDRFTAVSARDVYLIHDFTLGTRRLNKRVKLSSGNYKHKKWVVNEGKVTYVGSFYVASKNRTITVAYLLPHRDKVYYVIWNLYLWSSLPCMPQSPLIQ